MNNPVTSNGFFGAMDNSQTSNGFELDPRRESCKGSELMFRMVQHLDSKKIIISCMKRSDGPILGEESFDASPESGKLIAHFMQTSAKNVFGDSFGRCPQLWTYKTLSDKHEVLDEVLHHLDSRTEPSLDTLEVPKSSPSVIIDEGSFLCTSDNFLEFFEPIFSKFLRHLPEQNLLKKNNVT